MQFLYAFLFVLWLAHSSLASHPPSPCPDIFDYEGSEPENNRWYGEISLRTDESLVGIRLDIELDRPSDLMVSWLGETSSSDNVKYTILNLNQKLKPGPPVLSRIMVKFNRTTGSPKVRFIRLNGRKICPEDTNHDSEYEESFRPKKPQSTRRPDPEFGDSSYNGNFNEYPNSNGNNNFNNNNYRPIGSQSNSDSDNNNYRPTGSQTNNDNNYRPTGSQTNNGNNDNYRPTGSQTNGNPSNPSDFSSSSIGGGGIGSNRPKPTASTTTADDAPYPPTTTRKPNKGTTRPTYEGNGGGGNANSNGIGNSNSNNNNNNNRPSNPNTVSLHASSTDSSGFSNKEELNGVIDQILNNNKTVILAVINTNDNPLTTQSQNSNQNRPNSNSNNRPNPTDTSGQSRPTSNNNNNRPSETQQPSSSSSSSPSSSNQRPNQNQGSSSLSSTVNSHQPSFSGSCGDVKLAVPLVTSGQSTLRGQWPWHVALYLIEGINLSYHCGGSLVSKNKVITAAHCVTNKQNDAAMNANKLVIYLGKYHQLQYSDELGVQTKQVTRISVYPSYNSSNYLGDIAVLTLSSEVEFTDYVTPVCLWEDRTDLEDVVGKEGTVVGWGYDENDTPTEELKMARMPIVSHQTCLWSYPQFYSEFTSNKTFCAGFRNGTSVCNGDSGGGMVFNKNSRWYLRGIVSITVAKEGLRVCDTRHYVVFTDVSKYLDFIKKNLR